MYCMCVFDRVLCMQRGAKSCTNRTARVVTKNWALTRPRFQATESGGKQSAGKQRLAAAAAAAAAAVAAGAQEEAVRDLAGSVQQRNDSRPAAA